MIDDFVLQCLQPGCGSAIVDTVDRVKYLEKLAYYRHLVMSLTKFIDITRLLHAIDDHLRSPSSRVFTILVDDLDRLEAVVSTLDRERHLDKQSFYVLHVSIVTLYLLSICPLYH